MPKIKWRALKIQWQSPVLRCFSGVFEFEGVASGRWRWRDVLRQGNNAGCAMLFCSNVTTRGAMARALQWVQAEANVRGESSEPDRSRCIASAASTYSFDCAQERTVVAENKMRLTCRGIVIRLNKCIQLLVAFRAALQFEAQERNYVACYSCPVRYGYGFTPW